MSEDIQELMRRKK